VIRLDEALERLLEHNPVLEPVEVDLADSLGCVLAQDVVASNDIPPFDTSAMDGYALRAADLAGASEARGVPLRVLEDLPAGEVASLPVGPGECIRIMTGAPIPQGADTVVKQELTQASGDRVHIYFDPPRGHNIRIHGEDVAVGEQVIPRGKHIRAGDIGMLASLGFPRVLVHPRPVVAILSTGDELVQVHEPLTPGKIRNSNSYALAAQVAEAGAIPRVIGIARDNEEDLKAKLAVCLQADAVVTSGGVSVGDYDLVKQVLCELGEMLLWKVAMRPAKPLAFGLVRGTPLFGLPGNPSAVMVSFEQFVRPALWKMAGRSRLQRAHVQVILSEPVRKRPGLRTFVSVVLRRRDGQLFADLAGRQSSGGLRAMTRADGLLVLPEELGEAQAGLRAQVQLIYPQALAAAEDPIPVLSLVGRSNSGKTTLLEKIISELCRRGVSVVAVKHDAHEFQIDHPGKDSWRLHQAGARTTLISSRSQLAMVQRVDSEWSLPRLVSRLGLQADIILTEGYRRAAQPRIEVLRAARSTELLSDPSLLVAVATDLPLELAVPVHTLDDVDGLCDLIQRRFLGGEG